MDYESLKAFTVDNETQFQRILNYFNEKISIETSYIKDLQKLATKFPSLGFESDRTIDIALNSYLEYQKEILTMQDEFKNSLTKILMVLQAKKKEQDLVWKTTRDTIKPIFKYYNDLNKTSIPKSKANYYKKAEEVKELVDSNKANKLYKASLEANALEHAYRTGIVHLEIARQQLSSAKDMTRTKCQEIEVDRSSIIQTTLFDFLEAERVRLSICKRFEALEDTVKKIDPKTDSEIGTSKLISVWPENGKVYFEHFEKRVPAQSILFGIPLSYVLQNAENGIPTVIKMLFDAIEQRGIGESGIYRTSGNKQEIQDLRNLIEIDYKAFDFSDESLDVNTLAGLIKMFFRELPEPLLMFPAKERQEYSAIQRPEERIPKLKQRIKYISRHKQVLLRALAKHLATIAKESTKNKMTTAALAVVFSGVLFANQNENEKGKSDKDLANMEFLKSDLVIEDLLNNYETLFETDIVSPADIPDTYRTFALPAPKTHAAKIFGAHEPSRTDMEQPSVEVECDDDDFHSLHEFETDKKAFDLETPIRQMNESFEDEIAKGLMDYKIQVSPKLQPHS